MRILPTIDMAATGKNIARLREGVGLSVRALQALLGFTTPQAIYKWQRGESLPSIDNLAALAAVLDVGLDDIVICRNDKEKNEMLWFLLSLMIGGFFGFAFLCIVQIVQHCDEEKPQKKVLKI